jgi:hypothetical protein
MINRVDMHATVGRNIKLIGCHGAGVVHSVKDRYFLWIIPLSGWDVTFVNGHRAVVYPEYEFELPELEGAGCPVQ